MKILAIDTTGRTAAAALVDEDHTIAEFAVANKKTHSQILMPMIAELMKESEIALPEVDYIACAQGPGSFTGLRIGASTAKALAHSLNKPMVPVPTLDALAYNVYSAGKVVVPLMDARRNQVYAAFYIWEGTRLIRLSDYMATELSLVLERAAAYGSAIFLGDGAEVYRDAIAASGQDFLLAPVNMNLQRAASVGAVAVELVREGRIVTYGDFELFYLRKPQAERELCANDQDCANGL